MLASAVTLFKELVIPLETDAPSLETFPGNVPAEGEPLVAGNFPLIFYELLILLELFVTKGLSELPSLLFAFFCTLLKSGTVISSEDT